MTRAELAPDPRGRRAELLGQGFSRLDVGALREVAEMLSCIGRPSVAYFLCHLADRIEAMLPPEEPKPKTLTDEEIERGWRLVGEAKIPNLPPEE